MDQDSITRYIAATFSGVNVVVASAESGAPEIAWGDTFFIYDPDRNLEPKQQMPFATIVTKDYPGDRASNLDRPGVYRLNIGAGRQTFTDLFGSKPGNDSGSADAEYDYAELDRLLPHPVYAAMHWVCVLNPSESTFQSIEPMLAEAYSLAASRVNGRSARQNQPPAEG